MGLIPLLQQVESARFWRRYRKVVGESVDAPTPDSLRILIWPFRASDAVLPVEMLLGNALDMRGHEVRVAFCQGVFDACDNFTTNDDPGRACSRCTGSAARALAASGLEGLSAPRGAQDRGVRLSRGLSVAEMLEYEEDGIELGNIVRGSVLRFLLKGSIDLEADGEHVRRYFRNAVGVFDFARETIDRFAPDRLLVSHGIYLSWGIVTELAKQRDIPVIVWGHGYRRRSVIFVHGDSYHTVLRDDDGRDWRGRPLSPEVRRETVEYLDSRRRGDQDDISYNRAPEERKSVILDALGIGDDRPTFVLFTNLVWDAAVVSGHDRAFRDMLDWVEHSVNVFAERPEWQLIVRVHPAEVRGANVTRQKVADVLEDRFISLPENVRVVPPEDPTSSYALAEIADVGLVYSTKFGFEMAAMGKPVVVAGDAFYRNKGFTVDVLDRAHYASALEAGLARGASAEATEEAIRCAHHYFFVQHFDFQVAGLRPSPAGPVRRVIDRMVNGAYDLHISSAEELLEADPVLRICKAVERLRPFSTRNDAA